MPEALLVLEDGRVFRGESYGAAGETIGEAVFSTGMTGYQETLTDPSYHRQVVVMTAPHVGNTGVNDVDPESGQIWVAGYVVRDPARRISSWRADRSLDEELVAQGVVGISGVDTRALTRHLRERGAMRVGISTSERDPAQLLDRVRNAPQMAGAALSAQVSTRTPYTVDAQGERRGRVAAVDLGIKSMTPAQFAARGIECVVLPAAATLDDVLAVEPDGVFFSNGPGDPAADDHAVEVLRGVLERRIPYFGICFGNQLFGRALGLPTYKLKYGHRGINQPVLDLTTGKVEVTAHNHGFAVGWPGSGQGLSSVSGQPGREEGQSAGGWSGTGQGLSSVTGQPGREEGQSAGGWSGTEQGLSSVSRQPGREEGQSAVDTPFGPAEVTHICLNDGVIEGLRLRDQPAFSVQYHPEAAAGPHDAGYLFDRFVDLMAETSKLARHADETGPKLTPRRERGEGG